MINLQHVLRAHDNSIQSFGGGTGIRDEGSLLAAIARPYATFDQHDLYPSPTEKAAAIFESLIINHPFVDGNKRTAFIMLKLMLNLYGYDVMAFDNEKYKMTIAASSGEIRFDEIRLWIEEHLIAINP